MHLLPQELVDAIIDTCAQSHEPLVGLTLKACSLVSRAWANRARFHLLREIRLTEQNHPFFLASLNDVLALRRCTSGAAAVCPPAPHSRSPSSWLVPFTTFLRGLVLDDGTQWHESWLMATHCPLGEIDRCMQLARVSLDALTLLYPSIYYDDEGDRRNGEEEADAGLWLPSRLSSRFFRQFFASELRPQDCDTPGVNDGDDDDSYYVPGRAIRAVKKLTICGPTVYSFRDFQALAGAFPVLQVFEVEIDLWFGIYDSAFSARTSDTSAERATHAHAQRTGRAAPLLLPRSVHSIRIGTIRDEIIIRWLLRHFPEQPQQQQQPATHPKHRRHFATLRRFEVLAVGDDEDLDALVALLLHRVKAQYGGELAVTEVRSVENVEDDDDEDDDGYRPS